MQYEWVLFDLSGVLTKLALMSDEPIMVRDVSVIPSKLEQIYFTDEFDKYMLGGLSHRELVTKFLRDKNIGVSEEEFKWVYQQTIFLMPGMDELVKRLKQKTKLAVLTNEGNEWAKWKMEATGLEDLFEAVIVSAEIGKAKPNKDFFEESMKILKTDPGKCIFVDDAEENIKAAEKMGMKGFLFKNTEKLVQELGQIGVV